MKLTKAIIYAAALDAAKSSMRKRGLSNMPIDDVADDAYYAELDRLVTATGGIEGWIELS